MRLFTAAKYSYSQPHLCYRSFEGDSRVSILMYACVDVWTSFALCRHAPSVILSIFILPCALICLIVFMLMLLVFLFHVIFVSDLDATCGYYFAIFFENHDTYLPNKAKTDFLYIVQCIIFQCLLIQNI